MDLDISNIDKNIFIFLNGIHNKIFDTLMNWLSSVLLWIPLSFYIGYVLLKNVNLKSRKSLILNVFIILLFALFQYIICIELTTSFFESIVHRVRPHYDPYVSMFVQFDVSDYENKFVFFLHEHASHFQLLLFYIFLFGRRISYLK